MARPFMRSSSIVLRKYVFSLLRALMLRSHSQLVTPRVQSSFNAVWMFGKNDLSAAFKADAAYLSAAQCPHIAPIVVSNNATLHPYYLDLACLLCTHSETLLCFQRRLRLPRVVTSRALDRMHALPRVAHCQICCAVPLAKK